MADEKPSGAWGSSFVVLAFAAVSAAYVAWQPPALLSTRPTEPEYAVHDLNGMRQDIDARLWQDPLGAVIRDIDDRSARNSTASDVAHDEAGFDHQREATLVLGVTLPGASYPEVVETRRRLRYAVLAALHVAGFTPTDEKHIGYWRPDTVKPVTKAAQTEVRILHNDWPGAMDVAASGNTFEADLGIGIAIRPAGTAQPTDDPAVDQPPLPAIVPWEEFDNEQKHHVLVLWLDEDVLTAGRRPIASLAALSNSSGLPSGSTFALLGPEDSTMLRAMVHEEVLPNNPGFSMYNFGATAEEGILLHGIAQSENIEERLKQSKIQYYRTINSDDQLAEALGCELMRRDANLGLHSEEKTSANGTKIVCVGPPKGASNHIVLISDWDTVYGRDLSNTVKEIFTDGQNTDGNVQKGDSDAQKGASNDQNTVREWIRQVSYLRGLDGRLPDRQYTKQTASPQSGGGTQQAPGDQTGTNQPTAATPETASRYESAEGQSQFDYLRRLALDLKERDAEYRRKGEGHIGAIGVLGSDVYDKLLILQALRPELPEALFFTTDLDELLLPQNKSHYTRYLLVASSFGLTLNDGLQGDIPPFRNTYQTAMFFATLAAINNEPKQGADVAASHGTTTAALKVADQAVGQSKNNAEKPDAASPITDRVSGLSKLIKSWLKTPLLFQIGRTAPEALQPNDQSTSPCKPAYIFTCDSIRPDSRKLYPVPGSDAYFGAICTSAVLLLIVAFSIRPIREFCIRLEPHPDGVTCSANPKIGVLALAIMLAALLSTGFWWKWPWIADRLTEQGLGEPMSLFEGISLWPSILLRAFGAGLSLWLIFYTLRTLEDNLQETAREMSLSPPPTTLCGEFALMREQWNRITRDGKSYPSLGAKILALIWFDSLPRRGGGVRLPFDEFMQGFEGRRIARCTRALIATGLMFAAGFILTWLLGPPNAPARGSVAKNFFLCATFVDVLFTLFLAFLVADATLLSRAFIKRLTAVKTIWPDTALGLFKRKFELDDANLADWMDMQFLARRTRCITRIIYFPFIVLALLLVSRSELFDDLMTPWSILVSQAIIVAIVIGSAISLRSAAENARAVASEHLNAQIIAAKGEAVSLGRAARLEKLSEEIKNLREGAFAPWTSQPIVGAVLLPLLTYGGTWLLHAYALPGN